MADQRIRGFMIHDYSDAITRAIEWLGDRYLLATPINSLTAARLRATASGSSPRRPGGFPGQSSSEFLASLGRALSSAGAWGAGAVPPMPADRDPAGASNRRRSERQRDRQAQPVC